MNKILSCLVVFITLLAMRAIAADAPYVSGGISEEGRATA